ncbi:MAG: hypothetical protein ACK5SI_10525 [Planctomycetia bacterium]|jgi:hypothetical protein
MAVTVTVRDETTAGSVYHEIPLQFPRARISVRELIRERVYQEVQDFNRRTGATVYRGLVQPTDARQVMNGPQAEFHLPAHRQIDWKPQFDRALAAFARNGFFILVDDRQAESLDQEFDVGPATEISFVRLTLLVGG